MQKNVQKGNSYDHSATTVETNEAAGDTTIVPRECSVCKETFDESLLWVNCVVCSQIYHQTCVGVTFEPIDCENWTCNPCKKDKGTGAIPKDPKIPDPPRPVDEYQQQMQIIIKENQQLREKLKHLEAHQSSETLRNSRMNCPEINGMPVKQSMSMMHGGNFSPLDPPSFNRQEYLPQAVSTPPTSHHQVQNTPGEDQSLNNALQQLTNLMIRQNMEPLPEFDGNYHNWAIFYAQYQATSHLLDDATNMRRLRTSLTGEARRRVSTKLAYSLDPEGVILELKAIYGRVDAAVRRTVQKLRTVIPPDDRDAKALIEFRRELKDSFAALVNLEAHSYINSPTIVDDIIYKFPSSMMKDWAKYAYRQSLKPGDATLQHLVEWIETYTEWTNWNWQHLRTTNKSRSNHSQGPVLVHQEILSDSEEEQTVSHVNESSSNSGSKANTKVCPMCPKENHHLSDCKKFSDAPLNTRWDIAKNKHLCFVCLDRRHKQGCPKAAECGVDGCVKMHHKLLHRYYENKKEELNATVNGNRSGVTFRILPVKLFGKDKENHEIIIECNAFLDTGSAPTMISIDVANQLNLAGPMVPLCLGWMDGRSKAENDSFCMNLEISGIGRYDPRYKINRIRTVPKLVLPKPGVNVKNLCNKYPHLASVAIPQPFDQRPLILIGEEFAYLTNTIDYREGTPNQPIASRTRLGWVIHGKADEDPSSIDSCEENLLYSFICECKNDTELEDLMNDFFTQENFYKIEKREKLEGREDQQALQILSETAVNTGNSYQVGLLWKNDHCKLPDSRPMALRRLACLERQMKNDSELAESLKLKFVENIEKGYIRKLTPEEARRTSNKTWYLPIFGVRNPHKPSKLRVVYDAAAKANGVCLNDFLLKGPDLLNSLPGILLRARQGQVAISADIREMYHRVVIRTEDQDAQRILWRNGDDSRDPDVYVLQVMSFGARCSPSTAEWIKNQNARQFTDRFPRAVDSITTRHYVDDLIDSFNDPEEALRTAKEVQLIHRNAGFEIRNWLSNRQDIMDEMNETTCPDSVVSLSLEKEGTDKILGLFWDLKRDVFLFKLNFVRVDENIVNLKRVPTKRETLKVLMAIFDPLGFLSPIVVHGKILVQETWRHHIKWDDLLPEECFKKWCNWIENIRLITQVAIPRCLSPHLLKSTNVSLHIFTDASELAYCAVAYLIVEYEMGIDVGFVTAKSKVAPRNYVSVPRMELEAARLGVRMLKMLTNELTINIQTKQFWTDSRTVLSWIQSDHRKYKQFVANRVGEVLESTDMDEWRWIPGKCNVADEATKVHKHIDLSPSSTWFRGPEFLRMNQSEWPEWTRDKSKQTTTEEEIRTCLVNFHIEEKVSNFDFVDANRFSTWHRVVRTVAWVFRFITRTENKQSDSAIRKQTKSVKTSLRQRRELNSSEITKAENALYQKLQWESFTEEMISLCDDVSLPRESKLWKLSVYIDDCGVMRLRGRLDATPHLPDDFKRPIILEKSHRLTTLIILHYHQKFAHQCAETIVNELRQKYWFSEMRVAVKSAIYKCQACKNRKAQPLVPEMSPLPPERLMICEKPFSYVGIDFFGPLPQ